MLILFNQATGGGPTPPVLPNLYIKDAESLVNTPVAGNTGWSDDFLQAQTLCYVPLEFAAEETGLAALAVTEQYWMHRLIKALVRVNFSNSGANAVIRPQYEDDNAVVAIGASVTITATSQLDGVAYMAPIEVFETYGANRIAFIIDSISAGTVDISVAGV